MAVMVETQDSCEKAVLAACAQAVKTSPLAAPNVDVVYELIYSREYPSGTN